jgi:AraC-like DNA-binding protein
MVLSPVMFLTAPLFYLGIKGLTTHQTQLSKKDKLHFLPSILHAVDLLPLYLMNVEEKREVISSIFTNKEEILASAQGVIPVIWIDLVRCALMYYYFLASWKMIHQAGLVKAYLSGDRISSWFKVSLVYFGALQAVFLIQYLFNLNYYFTGVQFPVVRNISAMILFLTIIFYLFEVVRKAKITLDFKEFTKSDVDIRLQRKEVNAVKSAQERVNQLSKVLEKSSSDLEGLKAALNQLFEEELIFKEKDLTVADLAKRLKISVRHLPELLNQVYGKSFKDLVNHFRNRLAKEKIESGYLDFYTLESLAEEVGYNSRITFYNSFKKEFQVSPTELLNKKLDSQ